MKDATKMCQLIFFNLALVNFCLKMLSKSFVSLRRQDPVLELQFPTPLCIVLLCFCKTVSADRLVLAASWLLRALAAFVILLFFLQLDLKIVLSGCMKVRNLFVNSFSHCGAGFFWL